MKKWLCFIITMVLCVMLLTACGNRKEQQNIADNKEQQNISNIQEQVSTNSTIQDSKPENQENLTEAENQEIADSADKQQETTDSAVTDITDNNTDDQNRKVLVVYYSASGNTKAVADVIAQYTEGDTFEIIPVNAYTNEDLDWTQKGSRVNLEHEEESLQDIELVSTTVENFDSYDIIFIGYPIWWHEAAWVVNNFVKDNDFTGKTVIPFCTSSSSGLGESGTNLAAMAGTGNWQEGRRFSGNAGKDEVTDWLLLIFEKNDSLYQKKM